MKKPTLIASLMILALFAGSTLRLQAEEKVKGKLLIDFTVQDVERIGAEMKPINKYQFTYGDWQNKVQYLPNRGLLVPSVAGQGGMGGDKAMNLSDFGVAELLIAIGNRNEAANIAVTLIDSDGTEATWYLPLASKPVGKPLTYRMDLARCDKEEKPGKTPGLNKAKIKKWQIKGDWQPAKAEVLIMKLGAEQ